MYVCVCAFVPVTQKVETLGSAWFDLPATPMTPEIKQDLILIKNRQFLGPKSFYKGNDSKKLPKFFQVRFPA